MMNPTSWGIAVRDAILAIARSVASDGAPGVVSFLLFALLVGLVAAVARITIRRLRILKRAVDLVEKTDADGGLQAGLDGIQTILRDRRSPDDDQLAHAIAEYRETLLEPKHHGDGNLRNSVRPGAFINLDELHFGLGGWRFWSGLFVSIGLFLTFLGLIAALVATQQSLEVGGGDQKKMIEALERLLAVASAKFTMSLTGLFCSILFTGAHRFCASRLERAASALAQAFETRIDFVSLEGLADRQLRAIEEQTAQQQLLNTRLIAELSKPLERITATGTEAIGGMVGELGRNLTSSIGQSIDRVAERIDGAAEALNGLTTSLAEASDRFKDALDRSSTSFVSIVERLETVTSALTTSARSVAETTTPVMETARSTAQTARALADGSIGLIDAAKTAVDAERTIVVTSAKSIEDLIRGFEGRAKAYDGQLEKAFATYVEQVQRTLGELRSHGDGVHGRYAEALQVLQAVIENARAFVPESAPPAPGGRPS